jgi:hypothetical protein
MPEAQNSTKGPLKICQQKRVCGILGRKEAGQMRVQQIAHESAAGSRLARGTPQKVRYKKDATLS